MSLKSTQNAINGLPPTSRGNSVELCIEIDQCSSTLTPATLSEGKDVVQERINRCPLNFDQPQGEAINNQPFERVNPGFQVDSKFAAAYRVGVGLNELRFLAIQAFMLDRHRVVEDCLSSGALAAALILSVEDPSAQDWLLGLVRNASSSLRAVLARGDHLDDLTLAQGRLRNWAECPESVEHTCHEIAASLDDIPRWIVEQLRSHADPLLGLRERHLLRLGEFVDQMTRPMTIGSELLQDAIRQASAGDQATCQRLEWRALLETGQTGSRGDEAIWPASHCAFSRRPPAEGWRKELSMRWLAAGLGAEPLADILDALGTAIYEGPDRFCVSVAAVHDRAVAVLNGPQSRLRFDSLTTHTSSNRIAPVSPVALAGLESPGDFTPNAVHERDEGHTVGEFLGLSLNRRTFTAARGDHQPVCFRAQLSLFELCTVLVQNGAALTSRETLERQWERIGRACRPSKSTIDGAFSQLRHALRPMGIGIENVRNRGWRLKELDR
jgi:hypothetical protein